MIQGIYKYKDGKFLLSEGYGSVVEEPVLTTDEEDTEESIETLPEEQRPAKFLQDLGMEDEIDRVRSWFNKNSIGIKLIKLTDPPEDEPFDRDGVYNLGELGNFTIKFIPKKPDNFRTSLEFIARIFQLIRQTSGDTGINLQDFLDSVTTEDDFHKLKFNSVDQLVIRRCKADEEQGKKIIDLMDNLSHNMVKNWFSRTLSIVGIEAFKIKRDSVPADELIVQLEKMLYEKTSVSESIKKTIKVKLKK